MCLIDYVGCILFKLRITTKLLDIYLDFSWWAPILFTPGTQQTIEYWLDNRLMVAISEQLVSHRRIHGIFFWLGRSSPASKQFRQKYTPDRAPDHQILFHVYIDAQVIRDWCWLFWSTCADSVVLIETVRTHRIRFAQLACAVCAFISLLCAFLRLYGSTALQFASFAAAAIRQWCRWCTIVRLYERVSARV